ncbi:MAG: type I DNA topoisomerase [bacterium]|nr:type I DNA topoisomerase [bacterium]
MKNLVIVESPTKAKTIGKFLGEGFVIKASMGHVMDLPKSKISVDIEHDFKPDYQLMPDKIEIVNQLKSEAKKADEIFLATDPDREGEAIASHIADILTIENRKLKVEAEGRKSKIEKNKINFPTSIIKDLPSTVNHLPSISRIVFHEITKEAVDEAFKNPRKIDKNLVDAQTARRVLDRIVGYKLSPILWRKVRRGLSAGRVQSVALRLIAEREKEIEKFKKEGYFTITAVMAQDQKSKIKDQKDETEFELIEINQERIELQSKFQLYDGEYTVTKTVINTEEKANKIKEDLQKGKFVVADVLSKKVSRNPQAPFTTSTLQQEAARRLGFSGRRTMSLAQKLYEEGFITYHRTDSVIVSQSAILSMRAFVKKEFGDKYVPDEQNIYKTKQKLAQEAHEAIRPTHMGELQSQISNLKSQIGKQSADYIKLYELIWRRAVASQMTSAVVELTTVIVDSVSGSQFSVLSSQNNVDLSSVSQSEKLIIGEQESENRKQKTDNRNNYRLKANGSVLVFEGFLKVNPQALGDKKLPEFTVSDSLIAITINAEKKETQPPPRYNDASLIATLEEKGIGRPSTYAGIVFTIESRRYIERSEGRFMPTHVGIAVNDFLVKNFSDIDDIPFTAEMEDHLDNIAKGEEDWVLMMKNFYKPFEKELEKTGDAKRVKIEVEETNEKCPTCGSPLVIRIGRFGKFLSCSKFPECKFTKSFVEETNLLCPKDGGKIIIRKTKKGRKFYGCSNYPACDFAAWKLEDIDKNLKPETKDIKQKI